MDPISETDIYNWSTKELEKYLYQLQKEMDVYNELLERQKDIENIP